MQEIFNFLKSNWEIIAAVITLIISVIIALVRKKPVSNIFTLIYQWCISAIKTAERTEYKGQEKLNFAKNIVLQALQMTFPKLNVSYYEDAICGFIEEILTTPQKKGE